MRLSKRAHEKVVEEFQYRHPSLTYPVISLHITASRHTVTLDDGSEVSISARLTVNVSLAPSTSSTFFVLAWNFPKDRTAAAEEERKVESELSSIIVVVSESQYQYQRVFYRGFFKNLKKLHTLLQLLSHASTNRWGFNNALLYKDDEGFISECWEEDGVAADGEAGWCSVLRGGR